ncbi:MAG: cob(I)yrinic acid a,c-diamide adenosyltransferase [Dehalococcoidia bacterium]|nr:cob(I)yrinic acid a,c-diamide adenosyltransferase [Dehalococcoidia bacterium]
MKIYTRKGDGGETSLLYGTRVTKDDLRCEAYGTVDEAVSMLGLAKNFCLPEVRDVITGLQRDLFAVGTELATPQEHYAGLEAKGMTVKPEMVQRLEELIDGFESRVTMPREFIIPGACAGSAALDVARVVVRRAERRVVTLGRGGDFASGELLRYLNRLSDLVFILARYEEGVRDGNNSSY